LYELEQDPAQPGFDGAQGTKPLAARTILQGRIIFREDGPVLEAPSMHSMQVSETTHINIQGDGRFMAHSFDPNCAALIHDKDSLHAESRSSDSQVSFFAARHIEKGEELSFDYTTTEWESAAPFTDSHTGREMRGFKNLSPKDQKAALERGLLAPHILRLWVRSLLA